MLITKRKSFIYFAFSFILIDLLTLSCKQINHSNTFSIDGFVQNLKEGTLIIKKFDGETFQTVDSVIVKNGEFSYKGKISYPDLYRIYLDNTNNYFTLFIDNSKIRINTSLNNFHSPTICGSESNDLYSRFVSVIDSINKKTLAQVKQYSRQSEKENIQIKDMIAKATQQQIDFAKQFIIQHPHSPVSQYILYKYLSNEIPAEEYQKIYQTLDTNLNGSPYNDYIKYQLNLMQHNQVGQIAFNLVLPDTTGTSISLNSINGDYIILYFWSSWSESCKNINAKISSFYHNHKNKIKIVGISLDTNRKKWIESINADKMNWVQLSDLKGWKNYGARSFGIRSIPSFILLNSRHVIIYKGNDWDEMIKICAK
jgi:peroxiredoxin